MRGVLLVVLAIVVVSCFMGWNDNERDESADNVETQRQSDRLEGLDDDSKSVFSGFDALWGSTARIVFRDGAYYLDGELMEELRHENMPEDGLSLAMVNRVGRPDMYYLVLPRKLDIYTNCEFGDCGLRRSVIGSCCESPYQPATE